MSQPASAAPRDPRLGTSIYAALRVVARRHMAQERRDHTLQPTDLAHEAYLRLTSREAAFSPDSADFLMTAASVMRRILVDHARRRLALKRGGAARRVGPVDEAHSADTGVVDPIALDEALGRLRLLDEDLVRVVELRYFGGLTDAEIAAALNCSTRSVRRAWRVARAWLARELRP